MTRPCELCDKAEAVHVWRSRDVCEGCAALGQYWDSLDVFERLVEAWRLPVYITGGAP